jgi:hypothetical protein
VSSVFRLVCLCSDVLLETRGETEINSVPEPIAEKPPSTPEMDAHQVEEMANSMMLNSPLPNPKRSDEKLPEEEGSVKLHKEGGGEKLPAGTPIGKLIMPLY